MARIIGPLRLSFACAVLLAVGLATLPATAQQKTEPARALTAADYARAERLLNYNTTPLVFRTGIRPAWLTGERFWYRVTTQTGTEFLTVDPATATKAAAFDHAKLAAALSSRRRREVQRHAVAVHGIHACDRGRRDAVLCGRTALALRC